MTTDNQNRASTAPLPSDEPPSISNITQVSRPFFTAAELKYLHNQTIPESKKIAYSQKKHQVFQLTFQICKQLKFPLRVLATTMNYYQRYWLFNRFDDEGEDPFIVTIACVLLASKHEDTIKKLKDIQVTAQRLKDGGEEIDSRSLDIQRKAVMNTEFKLLQVLKFDLQGGTSSLSIERLVVVFAQKLKMDYVQTFYAWLVAFDVMSTPLCLMVPPHCIAVAILIITLNVKPEGLIHKYNKDVEVESMASILDNFDCYEVFRAPEPLVNEGIIYILDFYVHNINFSVLNDFMPGIDPATGKEQVFTFMDLKSRFNDLKIVSQASCGDREWLRQDSYLQPWDYTVAQKGSVRFMQGIKRLRFEEEFLKLREEKKKKRQENKHNGFKKRQDFDENPTHRRGPGPNDKRVSNEQSRSY